ncbi:MAG: ABC transporter permease [Nitrospinota bacterium]|nr:MAG: ABC transporter permease [Nitrospinota bacterium]
MIKNTSSPDKVWAELAESRLTPKRKLWRRLWRVKKGLVGLAIVLVAVILAITPATFAPHDPYKQSIATRLLPPAWEDGGRMEFLLGTDQVGRDYLSRIIYGARISMITGTVAVVIALCIGVTLGVVAGYYGRFIDTLVTNLVNIMMAFPFILLALAVIAILGPSLRNMIIVLGITTWPVYTRVARSEVLSFREREFVQAAKGLGCSDLRIILRHIFPNLLNSLLVLASIEVARTILREAVLSFLGLGVQPPTPSWGGMLSEGRVYMLGRWWLAAFPGLAIFITTLGINLLGDGLRDFLDPHLDV